jgi:hypothetical protein
MFSQKIVILTLSLPKGKDLLFAHGAIHPHGLRNKFQEIRSSNSKQEIAKANLSQTCPQPLTPNP